MGPRPLVALACLLAACGGGSGGGDDGGDGDGSGADGAPAAPDADPDQPDAGSFGCWPIAGTTDGGEVELGTPEPFEPVVDDQEMTLFLGPQGGVHMYVQSRISGLQPGNPDDVGDPSNPSTHFTAEDEDGQRVSAIECPFRLAYEAGGEPRLLVAPIILFMDPAYITPQNAEEWVGRNLRLTVEVVDSDRLHAVDEHVVVVGGTEAGF